MSEKNFMAYGDAERVLTGYANRIKQSPTTFVGTQAQWNALSAAQKAEYTLVDITDDEVASQADIDNELADMNNILGAKNLLPNNATTQVLNGITFTVNADGSITANGTANADTWLWLRSYAQGGLYLPTGRYIINGSVSEASDAYNWSVYVTIAGESTNLATDWGHDANGVEFENTSTSNQLISAIWIRSGAVLNNLLFKPMIRPASIKDDTYVPYSKTNSELTTELSNIKYKRITNGNVPIGTPITIANLYDYEEIVVKTWNSGSGWGHTMSFMPNFEHIQYGSMSQSASTYGSPDYWMYDFVEINATTGGLKVTTAGGSGRTSDLISVFGRLG